MKFCYLHGGVPSAKRKALIDDFRDKPECRVFLSTDAGSTGLNLQSASLLINIDLPWNPAVLEQRIARIYRLGQENPVQIINMVARDTIEERMLTKLKFKSDLAAGILDGGDDAVFIEGNKFAKIIDVVDDVMTDSDEEPSDPSYATAAPEPGVSKEESKSEEHNGNIKPVATENKPKQDSVSGKKSAAEVRDIVSGGLSALSRIAEVLREPDGVASLADALVKEDPVTGQTSINIPVADKAAVVKILSAFSALLAR